MEAGVRPEGRAGLGKQLEAAGHTAQPSGGEPEQRAKWWRRKAEPISRFFAGLNSNDRSWFLLPPTNSLRRCIAWLVEKPFFGQVRGHKATLAPGSKPRRGYLHGMPLRLSCRVPCSSQVVLGLVIANCVVLAAEPVSCNAECQQHAFYRVTQGLDTAFTAAFTLEILLQATAHCFAFGPEAYLHNGWNWLDLLSTAAGYVAFLPVESGAGLNGLRALRALRPLRALKVIPGQWCGCRCNTARTERSSVRATQMASHPKRSRAACTAPVLRSRECSHEPWKCLPPPGVTPGIASAGLRQLVECLLLAVPLVLDVFFLLCW
jgi:hypothetical protein